MSQEKSIAQVHPWVKCPIIASAPMLRLALAPLAVEVSKAGGFGFLAGGFDLTDLEKNLRHAKDLIEESELKTSSPDGVLPIGVGFLVWGCDMQTALTVMGKYMPAAVWLFAPRKNEDLIPWTESIRRMSGGTTKVWVQIGSASDALEVARKVKPDVLVVQGSDAGGHGLQRSAGIITLLPEVYDALRLEGLGHIPLIAAGGIMDGRGLAAALILGASGVALGTRFLAAEETAIARGYQNEVIRADDGGITTVRSKVYDTLRGFNDWPEQYGGRGVINQSFVDAEKGLSNEENLELYKKAMEAGDLGWGPQGRMTTYAGTGVGLVRSVKPASRIISEIQEEAKGMLERSLQHVT